MICHIGLRTARTMSSVSVISKKKCPEKVKYTNTKNEEHDPFTLDERNHLITQPWYQLRGPTDRIQGSGEGDNTTPPPQILLANAPAQYFCANPKLLPLTLINKNTLLTNHGINLGVPKIF